MTKKRVKRSAARTRVPTTTRIARQASSQVNALDEVSDTATTHDSSFQASLTAVPIQNTNTTVVQAKPNRTGMPDELKSGVEQLSGFDMSGVRVHRNSNNPASLNAHAYAQGQDIHLGSGQEQHLPHEAWHVVQQMQGRVRATTQVNGVDANDNNALEQEADQMGTEMTRH